MTQLERTTLEMLNHLLTRHPELAGAVESLAAQSQAKTGERSYAEWEARQFAAPFPHFVKQARVVANGVPGSTWVETGTFRGDTTDILRQHGSMVYSLEPEPALYAAARARFAAFDNVEIINGPSESVFPGLLPRLLGDVSFWLDGHYSGSGTYAGPNDTPIVAELQMVASQLGRLGKVAVLVDDIRLFNGSLHAYGAYPSLDFLVDWAREQRLSWHIEHDMFVARKL